MVLGAIYPMFTFDEVSLKSKPKTLVYKTIRKNVTVVGEQSDWLWLLDSPIKSTIRFHHKLIRQRIIQSRPHRELCVVQ